MKVISFNANSIRQRQHQLKVMVDRYDPDIIAVQETKVRDEEFPLSQIQELGFECEYHGQKTHYGVALLYKNMDSIEVEKGFPSEDGSAQRRLIIGRFQKNGEKLTVINGYFPQGENRDHKIKFPAKREYYANLKNYLQESCSPKESVMVIGDFNVAPEDNDLGIGPQNVKRWLKDGKTCFLPEEREWLQELVDWGLTDTFRYLYPEESQVFSWFDYRSRGFEQEPKRGLRIDHVMVTEPLLKRLVGCGCDYEVRAMEKPSDHCPVWAEFK
ncbi:exodeoxyribonuclease III [Bdellovibrionales bacterium]|nr:exodeoxyribonuclease III [Bdellovibrionales bacterium]